MDQPTQIPVYLLKNPSEPVDRYQELIAQAKNGIYRPVFVPVLEHSLLDSGIEETTQLLVNQQFSPGSANRQYGGIIFTSQRAVAAFELVVKGVNARNGNSGLANLLDETTIFYVVGQATSAALAELNLPCTIKGQQAGNGAALAQLILEEYQQGRGSHDLLFMVGETRRDIIPKTLQSTSLPPDQRIRVNEIEVYRSAENLDFTRHFRSLLPTDPSRPLLIVVFSPMGCESMLKVLGLLHEQSGKYNNERVSCCQIITIGPTTRDYLLDNFEFSPQAVARKPTPEAVVEAIMSLD